MNRDRLLTLVVQKSWTGKKYEARGQAEFSAYKQDA